MPELIIKEITSKRDLKSFVKFPFRLYAENEYWVPPIIYDELEDFDPKRNPSYEYSESKNWLAYKEGEIVGRIAAIKHGKEFEEHGKLRFGWIDFIDDKEVSAALLNAVENWAQELGAKEVHGPMGFTDVDYEGMLVEGFDSVSTIATIYNFPYYKDHLEAHGYEKAVDWIEFDLNLASEIPQKLTRVNNYIKNRTRFKLLTIQSKKDFTRYIEKFFTAVNSSYEPLYGFYKLTPTESERIIKKYFSFLSSKYVSAVVDENDEIVAFGITMPSLSEAFKKAKGRLFPFGFIHILKALRYNKHIDLYLVGALPEHQNTGVISMVFHELWKNYLKYGVKTLRSNPTLESNTKLFNVWKSIWGQDLLERGLFKRRRCYSKKLPAHD